MNTITNAIAEVYLNCLLRLLDEHEDKIDVFSKNRTDDNMRICIESNKRINELRVELKGKGY